MTDKQQHTEEFEELCSGYVLHSLSIEERARFEELLEHASDEQKELYEEMREAASQLALTTKPARPSDEVKQRLMAQISDKDEENSPAPVTPISGSRGDKEEQSGFSNISMAAVASVVLAIVTLSLVFYAFNLSSQLGNKDELIKQQQTQISQLQNEVQRKEELLSVIGSRQVDIVFMAGLQVNPKGYGKIIWDEQNNRALLQVANLPALPQNKDYQLWIIKDNKPVSAGVFRTTDPNNSFFKIEQLSATDKKSTDAFAVTMEPKGGMPQPTGDMYLMGNVKDNSN